MASFGDVLRERRELLGLEQAELADLVGTRQQTVSRWERNETQPRGRNLTQLAFALGVSPADLLAQTTSDSEASPAISRPVRPHLVNLPVAELSPEQFEQFMTDLAHLRFPDATPARYGSSGSKQFGIDIVVRNGAQTVATLQCKRHKTFGPEKVKAAIKDVEIDASAHYLVLTRVATPPARDEVALHAGWTLWDVEDLTRMVRQDIDRDSAVRLIDTYFPGWREPLLGVSEPGVWQSPKEFFQLSDRGDIYSHRWNLVGRADVVDALTDFAAQSTTDSLALLIGRGGIGKTRLLRSFAERAEREAMVVRFLGSAAVPPQQYELLPTSTSLMVIIDDAHERDDLSEVVAGILRLRPSAKVLLSLRPYGLAILSAQLRRIGVSATMAPSWELNDLSHAEAEALAREVLGAGFVDAVARRLAALTTDCPLVTVVGAALIKKGRLDPSRLEGDDSLRSEILGAFRDALVADAARDEQQMRRAVLDAIALLQPFRVEDGHYQATLAALTGQPFDRSIAHIRALESSGVVLRRGKSLRIVPDLLGDVIVAGAAFDLGSGTSTGYIERARLAAEGEALQHVFVNASRVDWQVRRDTNQSSDLADQLWDEIEREFQAAGIRGRRQLVGLIKKVAYFKPERALSIARWALANPTDRVEEAHQFASFFPPTYDDVLHELPAVLKAVAYSMDHLGAATDTLWDLAQRDARPAPQNPDHALRALQDLASYERGKPLEFNAAMVDAAEGWFDDTTSGPHSPFDVLEQLLATEGDDHTFDGRAITFQPFAIDADTTASVRDKVVRLALAEVTNPDVRRAARAVVALEHAVRYPHGSFGRPVLEAERARWTPGFVQTINDLRSIVVSNALDPALWVAIRKALQWHAHYDDGDTHDAAVRLLAELPDTVEHDLALYIHDGWGHISTGRYTDYDTMEKQRLQQFNAAAARALNAFDDEALLTTLEERLAADRAAFGPSGSAGPFCFKLFETRPSLATRTCREVSGTPTSALADILCFAVARVADNAPEQLRATIDRLLTSRSLAVKRQIAQALGWHRGQRPLAPGEAEVLTTFGRDTDTWVRTNVVHAGNRLAAISMADAVRIVTEVRLGDAPKVAEEICAAFGPYGFLKWTDLTELQQAGILDGLVECPSINDYHFTTFFAALSNIDSESVVDVLRRRVERAETVERAERYDALPYSWEDDFHFNAVVSPRLLRKIRDWIAANADSWQRRQFGGDLFRLVAPGFDDRVLKILEEGLHSGDSAQVAAVGAILQKAPRSLVWDDVGFVTRALSIAGQYGDDAIQQIGGAIHSAMYSGGARTGIPGEPFAEDVEQRDRAEEIASRLPVGSEEWRLYRSLAQSAEHQIDWTVERDRLDFDGRDW